MIPKCIGSTPNLVTTGKKIGVKISTAGVISIKVPTKSKIKVFKANVRSIKILSDGKYILYSSGNTVGLWDIENNENSKILKKFSHRIRSIDMTPNEKYIVVACDDYTIRLLDRVNGQEIKKDVFFRVPPNHSFLAFLQFFSAP